MYLVHLALTSHQKERCKCFWSSCFEEKNADMEGIEGLRDRIIAGQYISVVDVPTFLDTLDSGHSHSSRPDAGICN